MSYANKCVRANKSFFLLNGDAANMIPQDVYLNGKIIAVPRKGVSSEYKIVWDTTTIAEPPNKEDLRVAINRDDIRFVRELKNARMLYDSTSSSSDRGSGTISESNRRSARMENSRETRQSTNSGQDVVVDTGRMVSRLRMNPILMSTPTTNNNLDLNGNENNDSSESEEEDNMHGFHKDDECFTGDDDVRVLNVDDLLHGYLPDNGYEPTNMEEDGQYNEEFEWRYEDIPSDGIEETLYHYEGRGPALRHNVCNKFTTVLESCGVAGGFTYELIKRITANSNAYVHTKKIGNQFAGSLWKPIQVQEMFRALGIILKMSIDNRQVGGLSSYFSPPHELCSGPGHSTPVIGFTSWASDVMPEYRFRQIRAALYPEIQKTSVQDKCHQLRASILSLNEHAKRSFILGKECSFDEGGIANKSHYNPVHQYNASKPDKYRIDFFVLVNLSQCKNFIYHLDIYQGKNSNNAHIVEEAWHLPTTQKAVVNAIISSGIHNNPEGMREIYMDNRYTAPELFLLLRERYQILACGTIRSN